jgi:plastocyanin
MNQRRIIIVLSTILVALVVTLGGLLFAAAPTGPQTHQVVLTSDGFVPKELTIAVGDTVEFSTDRTEPFWPASNVHPEHTIFPLFDPQEPIPPDTTWKFTFDIPGRYSYHDHIAANYTGKIIVAGEGEETYISDITACASIDDIGQKQQCWDEQLERVLEVQGLSVAFDYFVALYQTEPDIPKACHGWGHILGKAGYDLYKAGEDPGLRAEASYCGYGYFHGFIAALISDTGDITKAAEFCEYAVETLQDTIPGIYQNCVHGIGHGATSMLVEDPNNWGKFQYVVDEATKICEALYTAPYDLQECFDGVYNEIHQVIHKNDYGFSYDEFLAFGDPFYYCQLQKEEYKESCYFEFAGLFLPIYGVDVLTPMKYALENVEDLETRGPRVISKISADHIQSTIVRDNHSDSLEACAMVPGYLFDACFDGILNGFIQHGDPKNLHDKGFAFCEEPMQAPASRTDCYQRFVGKFLSYSYNDEKFAQAYAALPEDIVID